MADPTPDYTVSWPTLWIAPDWVERHCVVPDGFDRGNPFEMVEWQLWALVNFYRLKPEARVGQLAPAFHWRRSQIVMPQKAGKAPYSAAHILLELIGPSLFAGWATGGETYRCRDWGCPCGWVYRYRKGEAMGRPRPTPLIQVTAFSSDQTDNIWDALKPMIQLGPLDGVLPHVGEDSIKSSDGGEVVTVTSNALSRLGQRVTFVASDEALALDTPLPTPTGWTTMGAVIPGDRLIGSDGRPVTVTKATAAQHERLCYRVNFQDGTSVVASDGHRWMTRVSASAALPRVRTTGEMVADGRRFRIPAAAPYDLPEADLPYPPYALGLWLGDGATGKAEITAHDDEADELAANLSAEGVSVYVRRNPNRAATLCLSRKAGFQGQNRPASAKALQALPCYRAKHIPDAYLRGSLRQREALLQGLMDSDGHVGRDGRCTFAGNDRLTADVVRLLRTLGLQVDRVSRADPRARTGFGWKVHFTPRGDLQPFRLKRKAERTRSAWSGSDWVSVSIEPALSVPVRCVEVDAPDHLFLAGEGGHVTHNTGIWFKQHGMHKVSETQARGASGMGGRVEETTNAWNPREDSTAQRTAESKLEDIFRLHPKAPASLKYTVKAERRKIHRIVYRGCPWIDLDAIEAEALALMEHNPTDAERFFGNRAEAGGDTAFDADRWAALTHPVPGYRPDPGAWIVAGCDGARFHDAVAVIATEVATGFTWTVGIWERPDGAGEDYEHPADEVHGAVAELFEAYAVGRLYVDPQWIDHLVDQWIADYGEKRVIRWYTNRRKATAYAVRGFKSAVTSGDLINDGNTQFAAHVGNAKMKFINDMDDDGKRLWVLSKDTPNSTRKIDAAMAAVLSWEARGDAIADGPPPPPRSKTVVGIA